MTDHGVKQPYNGDYGDHAGHLEGQDDTDRYLKGNPFGDEKEGESSTVKYVTMSWWHCGIIMIAETIALGILSLPSVVARLGLAPACTLIVGLGLLATYTGYNLGQFKLRYPHVHSMADAGEVLMGPIGREVLGAAQLLFLIFISGSHVLTFGIMLNTLSDHGTCTIVFNVIGLIVCFLFTLPRTLLKVSWLSLASFISLLAALFITMIAIGIQHPGKGTKATNAVDFVTAFGAVTNIIFAYAGHVAFFGFISEMRRPQDYDKALYLLQASDTILYLVAAVVIYYYAGDDVASPALGTTSLKISKIAYGIAIPTIVIAGIINAHVAAKQIYVRIFRGTKRMGERSFFSVGVWVLIIFGIWVLAWIIAEAIPVFNNLLSLIVALFASWFTYGLSGVFWLHLNWGQLFASPRKVFLTIINAIVVLIGAAIMVLGLWVSGVAIHDDKGHRAFSCANTAAERS